MTKTADIADLYASGIDLAEMLLTAEIMQEPEPDPDEVNLHLIRPREDEGTVVILDCEAERMTDTGNARILVRLAGNDMRWCATMPGEGWMLWDGSRWRPDTTRNAYRIADMVSEEWRRRAPMENADLVKSKEEEAEQKARKAILAWANKCESAASIRNMLEVLRSRQGIATETEWWDADPMRVNTPDATYNLRTATRYVPRREDLITRRTAVGAELADCPIWRAFLLRIMGGPRVEPETTALDAAYADPANAGAVDLVRFLQRAAGYALTGDTSEQCMFVAYGTGGNGKGVFLNTLKAILGTYAQGARVETFVDRKAGGIPNDLAALRGARFVLCSEPEEGAQLEEGLIKMVTGQDTVTARFLNREFFDYIPEFKLWMMTNHKPIIKGTDRGIWRRMRLVPFTVSVPEAEKDAELPNKLKGEYMAILRWMIDGLKAWRAEGLNPPAAVREASEEYRREMDTLANFIEERCEVNAHLTAPNGELYASYKEWMQDNGMRPKSHSAMSRQLSQRGFVQASSRAGGQREVKGIGLVVKARGGA